MAKSYTIYFRLDIDGEIEIEANSQEDAFDEFHDMADADLIDFLEWGGAHRKIVDVDAPPSALEKLAEQAE